jgi:carbonic anhydrase
MAIRDEIQNANEQYTSSFEKGSLAMPPARRFAVVTCMDARLDPAKFLGLEEGDAHVIRNAGGLVTDDALRSLAISHWLLSTQEVIVIAHTDCGMLTFTNDDIRGKLRGEGIDADHVDFLPFPDLEASVRSSVERVRQSSLLPDSFGASGYVYDVRSGALHSVAGAEVPTTG